MNIEQSPTYITLPEHAKPAWLVAPVRRTVISVYKAGVYSRASGSFKEGFGRMRLLAGVQV
jgi:hypothetical protein